MKLNPCVVDISHYQNMSGNWAEMKGEDGILGVINKATEGPGLVDSTFAARRAGVLGAGLLYGAYHFLRPGDPIAQAEHFLRTVGDSHGLLLALDHEDPRVPLEAAKAWLEHVNAATGRWPVIYSGFLLKQQAPRMDETLSQCRLWLAQYSTRPSWPGLWTAPWLWQYTSNGHDLDGDEPVMDFDSFDGDEAALRAQWSGEAKSQDTSAQAQAQQHGLIGLGVSMAPQASLAQKVSDKAIAASTEAAAASAKAAEVLASAQEQRIREMANPPRRPAFAPALGVESSIEDLAADILNPGQKA